LHLFFHDNSDVLLFLLASNSLLNVDRLRLVTNLLLLPHGLLQNHPLDCGLMRPEHLLLSLNDFHLPSGLHSGAVLVLFMYMAVFVPMQGVGNSPVVTALVAGACRAASSFSSLAPERSLLMLVDTAAATPSSLATALAGARTGLQRSVAID